MFKSLCDAILAFHSLDPPLAHRDIKVCIVNLAYSNFYLCCIKDSLYCNSYRSKLNSWAKIFQPRLILNLLCLLALIIHELGPGDRKLRINSEKKIDGKSFGYPKTCDPHAIWVAHSLVVRASYWLLEGRGFTDSCWGFGFFFGALLSCM